MRKRRFNTFIIAIGIILALVLAVAIQFFLPDTLASGLKRIIFFVTIVVIYFIVIVINAKLHR